MKILAIHSDFIEFEAKKKAIKSAEEIEKGKVRVDECLVVFMAVEKEDEGKKDQIVKNTVSEIEDIASQVKTIKIVVYPYVHLSSSPSSPSFGLEAMKAVEKELREKKFEVTRAPFGWYKAFDISCKGHPLSELSREIKAEKEDESSKALKAEKKLASKWFILDTDGKLNPIQMKDGKIEGYRFPKDSRLEKLVKYEISKVRTADKEPPHVNLMKKLELVDYEPASDPGNLRYPPKGRLVKSLLEDLVTRETIDYGAMEIEAPIMFDANHPTLKKYLDRFPARQYIVTTPNKKCFLRFAACFGQFLMAHDSTFSYKQLPLRIYELTKYSFRAEKRGELTGLRRLRAFTMPDCHALCKDIPQAKEEMLRRFDLAENVLSKSGLVVPGDFEFAIRIVKDFWEENKDFVAKLVRKMGKPALVEMWDKKFFYFIMKYEWNFVDALDKASTLATDQIDVENGERYDIVYTDTDGKQKHPIILHLSPSGAVERVIYALLEREYMKSMKGIKPQLPLWLSPTQVRICPVSEQHNSFAMKIAEELVSQNIRADVDDREESIGKKIRNAETEWVPYIVVVGEKEEKSGKLSVRIRENGRQVEMSRDDLAKSIREKTENMPFKKLSLPMELSKRPVFIG